MFSLKKFLDGLVDENHPFRKGPDFWEGSAMSLIGSGKKAKFPLLGAAWEEQQMRFYFMRLNKN